MVAIVQYESSWEAEGSLLHTKISEVAKESVPVLYDTQP